MGNGEEIVGRGSSDPLCSCGNPQGVLGGSAFFIDVDPPPVSEPGCPLVCLSVERIVPDDGGCPVPTFSIFYVFTSPWVMVQESLFCSDML